MKKIFLLLVFVAAFLFPLTSCLCKKKTPAEKSQTEAQRNFEKEGYVKGTVVFYELDACKYIIQLVSDPTGPDVIKQIEPANLPADFQKDQLAVWVKYVPQKGAVSACMAGEIVEITGIQLRK